MHAQSQEVKIKVDLTNWRSEWHTFIAIRCQYIVI